MSTESETNDRHPLPQCPACREVTLTKPGVCPRCGTLRLFLVSQKRTKRVVHERQVWATSAEAAIANASQSTPWPESYDERLVQVIAEARCAVEITDDETRKINGSDVGFYDDEYWPDR